MDQSQEFSFDKPIESKTVKFNRVGDNIIGTLMQVSKTKQADRYGKISAIFTFKSRSGKYHGTTTDKETGDSIVNTTPEIIGANEEWTVFAEESSVLAQRMKSIKIGQVVQIKFTEIIPAKVQGRKPTKVKEVYPAMSNGSIVMDNEWLESKKQQVQLNSTTDEFAGFEKAE